MISLIIISLIMINIKCGKKFVAFFPYLIQPKHIFVAILVYLINSLLEQITY